MIILSGVLVVVAIALLVVGIVAGNSESAQIGGLEALTLIYISIAVSIVSLLCLVIGVILRRKELFGVTGSSAARPKAPKKPGRKGKKDTPATGTAAEPASAGEPGDEYPILPGQPVDVPADAIVHVVRGRKRYHLDSCRQLAGRVKEELTYSEAIEEGFSPCTACLPDTALAARAAVSGQSTETRPQAAPSTKTFAAPASYAGSPDTPASSVPPAREASSRPVSERAGGVPSAWPVPGAAAAAAGEGGRGAESRRPPSTWRQSVPEPLAEWDAQSEDYPDLPLEPEITRPEEELTRSEPELSRSEAEQLRKEPEKTRTDIPRPAEPLEKRSVFERTRPEPVTPEVPEPAAERSPAEQADDVDVDAAGRTDRVDVDVDDEPDATAVAGEPAAASLFGSASFDDAENEDDGNAEPVTDTTPATVSDPDFEPAAEADTIHADDDTDEQAEQAEAAGAGDAGDPQVRILSGTKRYHRSNCALIEDIGDDAEDLEALSRTEAKARGCTPCLVCQPDKERVND